MGGFISGPTVVHGGGTVLSPPKLVTSITTDDPAASAGEAYIVPVGGTGVFAGHDNDVALYSGSVWTFIDASESWFAYVDDEDTYYLYTGVAWESVSASALPALHAITHISGGADALDAGEIGANVKSGFPNRTDSVISMSGADFIIAAVAATYDYWIEGVKHSSAGHTATIVDDQAISYVYYTSAGAAVSGTTPWDFLAGDIPIATVYKDGATYILTDERHVDRRNRWWHEWAHKTIGARYQSGLAGSFLDDTFSFAQGIIADEDIFFDTAGAETTCQQWYRNGGLTSMRVVTGKTTPYLDIAGLIYDNAGAPTALGSNKYMANYFYGTNGDEPIVMVVGQNMHNTAAAARNEALPSILLDVAEWKLLYRTIHQNAVGTPTFIESTDFRTTSTGPASSASPADHAGLTGRDSANQHPATAITNTPAGSIAATEVQAAIDELDAEKAALLHAAAHEMGGADEIDNLTQLGVGIAVPTQRSHVYEDIVGLVQHLIENPNAGIAAVVGASVAVKGDTGWGLLGYTGSGASIHGGIFGSTLHLYNQGFGNNLYTNDGNHDHVFYSDPLDRHTYQALLNEIMRLAADGTLTLTGNIVLPALATVDGRDISADGLLLDTHASRHQNGGADEIATETAAAGAIPKAEVATGKLDIGWMPDAVVGGMNYQGTWNATTNSPTLADGTGTQGHFYIVDTAGSQDLGSGSLTYAVGDWVVHNGAIWQKMDHTDQVTSVHGRIGAVVAVQDDYTHAQASTIGVDDHHTQLHAASHSRNGGDDITVENLKTVGTDGQTPVSNGSGALVMEDRYETLNFVIDGGGSAISTGIKGDAVVDFAGEIISATLLGDQSGSIVVDIWKDTYANFAPTVADSITASAKPTISGATKSQDPTLTGWTKTIAAGDILRFNVDSIATLERCTVSLKIKRT